MDLRAAAADGRAEAQMVEAVVMAKEATPSPADIIFWQEVFHGNFAYHWSDLAQITQYRIAHEAPLLARIAELEVALVTAAIPLEAILMSGADAAHCQDVRDAIHDAVQATRAALATKEPSHD